MMLEPGMLRLRKDWRSATKTSYRLSLLVGLVLIRLDVAHPQDQPYVDLDEIRPHAVRSTLTLATGILYVAISEYSYRVSRSFGVWRMETRNERGLGVGKEVHVEREEVS